MSDFKKYFNTLIKHEGGFVNHPNDPGGATNKGITLNTFKIYSKSVLNIEPTLDNLKNITNDQAYKIYKVGYWDKIRLDEIEPQELAEFLFDFYVNTGNNAIRVLQNVLVSLNNNIIIDGLFGNNTLTAINNADKFKLYELLYQGRLNYYYNLARQNARYRVFLNGWINRVKSFPSTINHLKNTETIEQPKQEIIESIQNNIEKYNTTTEVIIDDNQNDQFSVYIDKNIVDDSIKYV